MKKVLCAPVVLLLCLIAAPSSAFDISGIQPVAPFGLFSVFSAESLPVGKGAIEFDAERSREPDFYRFRLKGAYGFSDSVELSVTAPYIHEYQGDFGGLEDMAIGLKHRFYDEGKYGPSVAYLLSVSLDTARSDFGTRGRYGAGLIISKRVGPFRGHFNLCYKRPGDSRLEDEITFAGGIEFAAANNFKLLGEVLTRKNHDTNEYDQAEARVGYRLNTADSFHTTLGVGIDLKDRSPEYRVMLSVAFLFPGEKKEIKKIYEEEQ